ncbi:MAG: ABC transporter permease subunit [Ignavibacteria bacterium]|jgi:ABC-2 type transport system permease protein
MQNIKTIYLKELKSYFNSPVAYIVIIVFLALVGWFFVTGLFANNVASMRSMFDMVPFIFLFFIPAVTMRSFSEEKKQGTIELLLTKPVKDIELVVGKYIAAFVLTLIALLPTLIYLIVVMLLGETDKGAIIGGYLGLILMSAVYIGVGIFASSLTENQVVAFIVSFIIVFALFMMGKILMQVSPGLVSAVEFISTDYHSTNISRGVIDTRNLIYYFSMIFLTIFLTKVSLESRKW